MVEKSRLTPDQLSLVEQPIQGSVFLDGAAGSGKTTVGLHRLLHLLDSGVPAGEILVLVPQRALEVPYLHAVRGRELPPGGQVTITTLSGIAAEMIELFWAVAAPRAGFSPESTPTFLSLETAQYSMSQIVDPLIDEYGYFSAITIDRNRLYSQILDNLNKAAVVGFEYTEIAQRLKDAWLGESAQYIAFDQVQECAEKFRAYCLERSLIDFSLQTEIFAKHIWTLPECREYLLAYHAHLIVDNVEEDNPAFHDVLIDWLPEADSALVIYDDDGGFRTFLGSDPQNALRIREICDSYARFSESFVTPPPVAALGEEFARVMDQDAQPIDADPRDALAYRDHHFYPEMLNWVADEIVHLVNEEGCSPGQIVVLAPFLSDALRFSLINRLTNSGIPARSHRPSRALREEPVARCLLTLAQLAHPQWGLKPTAFDVAYALMGTIGAFEPGKTLDLVRAQLLAEAVYPDRESRSGLAPFESLAVETQERVSYVIGERYDALRGWLEAYIAEHEQAPPPPPEPKKKRGRKKKDDAPPPAPEIELDHFFSLIFGEVLSQLGFGFYGDFEAARVSSNLIDSARDFRRALSDKGIVPEGKPIGQEYIEMVGRGLIAAQYLRRWHVGAEDSVLIAPAYTFLMTNTPVEHQFWLDIGNRGWFERLYQPLTHPYVLSKWWDVGTKWTDEQEVKIRQAALYRLIIGLVRRCRGKIYLGLSDLSENGYESQGELLNSIQRILRRLGKEDARV